MTLLPQLRSELVDAMTHGPARRRPRAQTLLVPALAAAALLLVLAWPRPNDIEREPAQIPSQPEIAAELNPSLQATLARPSPMGPVQDGQMAIARVKEPDGLAWTAVAYDASGDSIAISAAPDQLREPVGVWANGVSAIASSLRHGALGQVTVTGVRVGTTSHLLISGTVDARARTVTVRLGQQRATAVLSDAVLTRRVPHAGSGPTAEAKKRTATLPGTISLRTFAAAFAASAPTEEPTVQPHIDSVLADGSVHHDTGARFCVDRTCGTALPHVDASQPTPAVTPALSDDPVRTLGSPEPAPAELAKSYSSLADGKVHEGPPVLARRGHAKGKNAIVTIHGTSTGGCIAVMFDGDLGPGGSCFTVRNVQARTQWMTNGGLLFVLVPDAATDISIETRAGGRRPSTATHNLVVAEASDTVRFSVAGKQTTVRPRSSGR